MKKLIVTTTHNGKSFLLDLLADFKLFNIKNNEVCIVDNSSTDQDHLNYLQKLRDEEYIVLENPLGGFNIGGFKKALDTQKADVWFLMQDSLRIKRDIFSEIIPKLTNKNVYTFLTFPCGLYDNHDDVSFMLTHYGTTKYSKACFPHSYFALNEVLQKVKKDWHIPKNKIEACGMERGTAIVFDKYGIEINGLGLYTPELSGDPNHWPFFAKIYGNRNH